MAHEEVDHKPPESAASRAAAAAAAAGKPMKPPAQCPYCGMTFRKLEHCQRHERTHTLDRPYACSVCAKTFARQDTLNRHVRLHTRAEEGSPAKPRRRRIKSVSSLVPPPMTARTADAERPSPRSTSSSVSMLPLDSTSLAPSYDHRRNSELGQHPTLSMPYNGPPNEGRAFRERGFSLNALEDHRPPHAYLWSSHGHGRQPALFVASPDGHHGPAVHDDQASPHTSLLSQYPLAAAPPAASRPALYISTAATASVGGGLPTAPAAFGPPGWSVPWSQPTPGTMPSVHRSHSVGDDTFADLEHPILGRGSIPSTHELAARQHAMGVGAVAPNSFGLSGVTEHQPPTLGAGHPLRAYETLDWPGHLHQPHFGHAHPSHASLAPGPGSTSGASDDYGVQSPLAATAMSLDPAGPFSPHISSPHDDGSSSRGRGSSSVGSRSSTGFLRNGSLPRAPWDVAEPMLVPGSGAPDSGNEGSSLASSLRTEISSKSPADADPTLASAELAQTLSSQGPYPGYDDVGGGMAATAPGLPHMGMPNSLSYLSYEKPLDGATTSPHSLAAAAVRLAPDHLSSSTFAPVAPTDPTGPSPPSEQMAEPAVRLTDAVDDWRRMFVHRASCASSTAYDDAGSPAFGRRPSDVLSSGSSHVLVGGGDHFLPLLDHPDSAAATTHVSRSGTSSPFVVLSATGGAGGAGGVNGFVRLEPPHVAVSVLQSPAPSSLTDGAAPSSGIKGASSASRSPWPLTPGESPHPNGTSTVAMDLVEDF